MFQVRRSKDRGRTNWGWLESRHTFSFGEYHDPDHVGFGSLRVSNDDREKSGAGFGTHGHRDMEIISYLLEGGFAHKDSMAVSLVLRPGEVQLMRASTGIEHSEFNQSKTEPIHSLQIWTVPGARGLSPAHGQQPVDQKSARESFALLASKDGRQGSLRIHQDADVLCARFAPGDCREFSLDPGRHARVHIATGSVLVDGVPMDEGDGAGVSNETTSEVLLFDLA